MTIDEALDFIRANHRAVMASTRSDGQPAMSPVAVDVDPESYVIVSTRQTAMKVRHVRARQRVAVCVMSDAFYGSWVQVEGDAHVVELPEAMEGLVEYYRRVAGEHPDWDDYRAAMEREQRVLIRVKVDRAGPNQQG